MSKEITYKELTQNNWTAILRKLSELEEDSTKGSCVLFLGPEALISKYENKQNNYYKTMLELLIERALKMMSDDKVLEIKYLKGKPSPFMVWESFMSAYKGDGETLWKMIFDEVYTPENLHPVFYEKFPYIPIPIIINTSPDRLVEKVFKEKAGITGVQFSFYDYRSNSSQKKEDEKLSEPTLDTPIVYNLFGIINNPKSTVSSTKILLEYVFSILSRGHEEIDNLIYNTIKLAKYFIFWGFDFESWHLKLLLRFFNIKSNEEDSKVTYARPWNLEKEETMNYFKELFNVTFVKYDLIDFISELHEKCNHDPGIQIRKPVAPHQMISENINKENLRLLIENNRILETLGILDQFSKERNLFEMRKNCTLIIQEYNGLTSKHNQKLITEEGFEVERNLLSQRIIEIIDKIN